MIRILLVDDQNLVQQGIKSLLEKDPTIEVIGTVTDGRSAIKQIDLLRPDIVLLDIEMPGMDGITATKYISRLAPKTKIIILSSHEDKKYLTQALMAGAKAYLLKTSLLKDLRQAILAVDGGYSHIESRLLAKIFTPSNLKPQGNRARAKVRNARPAKNQLSKPQNVGYKPPSPATIKEEPEQVTVAVVPQGQDNQSAAPVLPAEESQPTVENLPDSSCDQASISTPVQIVSEVDSPPIRNSMLSQPQTRAIEEVSNRAESPSNPRSPDQSSTLAHHESHSSQGVNQFLPAIIIQRSASELSPRPEAPWLKLKGLLLKSKNYLQQIANQPQVVRYRRQLLLFYQTQKARIQPRIDLAQEKFIEYKTKLTPIIKEWHRKGWLANAGLVLLGLITVIIIHQMFA